jgi:methylated-DNA-protein-cysteine methyltransferase related protein
VSKKPQKRISAASAGDRSRDFFQQVYQVTRLIPRGRVTSYGAIAAYLGAKGSSRLVGYAMNGAGRVKPKVPAHRVVNRAGILTGKHHFADPHEMQRLLEKEKVEVKDDRVVEFQKLFWDPAKELSL